MEDADFTSISWWGELQEKAEGWIQDHLVALVGQLIVALLVLLMAYIAARVAARLTRKVLERTPGARAMTLAPSAASVARGGVLFIGVMVALDQLGLDIKALLAGAGVLGLAVGFGAQSLVKDWLSGFFIIFDGVVQKGDLIELHNQRGIVEEVGLRMTHVRSYDGVLWYVPNGQVDIVGNSSRSWRRFIVDVSVAYEGDVAGAIAVLEQVGKDWYEENKDDIALEPPEAVGATGLNASDITLRLVGKVSVREVLVFGVERELRQRIKARFDEAGVEIPFPRQVVYHRQEPDADRLTLDVGNGAALDSPASETPVAKNADDEEERQAA